MMAGNFMGGSGRARWTCDLRLALGHGRCVQRRGEFGGAVRPLPLKTFVLAAEVTARGSLAENGLTQLEIFDDAARR